MEHKILLLGKQEGIGEPKIFSFGKESLHY